MSSLPAGVQARLDEHLDAIETALGDSGMGRGERRAIVDEVEQQIQEVLAARSTGEPSVGELDAVLAEMDPPAAYAENAAPTAPRPAAAAPATPAPGRAAFGLVSLLLSLLAVVTLIVVIVLMGLDTRPINHDTAETLAMGCLLSFLAAFILGLIGWRSVPGKTGAVLSGLFLTGMLYQLMRSGDGSASAPSAPRKFAPPSRVQTIKQDRAPTEDPPRAILDQGGR